MDLKFESFHFRISSTDKKIITDYCKKLGITISDFFRLTAMEKIQGDTDGRQ